MQLKVSILAIISLLFEQLRPMQWVYPIFDHFFPLNCVPGVRIVQYLNVSIINLLI